MSLSLAPAQVIPRRRYTIGVMLLLVITIAYVDRISMSVAGPAIGTQFHLSDTVRGLVYSSFFWGYAAAMLPGGWFIDWHGKSIILPLAVFAWTLISMSTALVYTLPALFIVRILLGFGEAPAYPSSNLIVREWSPVQERGVFTALMQTGSILGPGLAAAPAAWLVKYHGWRSPFIILSALGFVWLLAWLIIYRKPEHARWLSDSERDYILNTRKRPESTHTNSHPMSFTNLIRQRPMIGILLANGPQTYTLYLLLTWLPDYLTNHRQFDLMHSGILTSAAFLVATIAAISLGHLSDRYLKLTHDQAIRGTRRRVIAIVMLIALLPLPAIPWIMNRYALVLAFALTLTMVTVAITLTYALTNDLIADESSAGRTFAMVSFGGQCLGLLAPTITGWISDRVGFTPVFCLTATLLFLGATSAWTLPTRQLQPSVKQ